MADDSDDTDEMRATEIEDSKRGEFFENKYSNAQTINLAAENIAVMHTNVA
ncbi:MAG: hypothetical protein R3B84_19755 [Zavarzinella sp.]